MAERGEHDSQWSSPARARLRYVRCWYGCAWLLRLGFEAPAPGQGLSGAYAARARSHSAMSVITSSRLLSFRISWRAPG